MKKENEEESISQSFDRNYVFCLYFIYVYRLTSMSDTIGKKAMYRSRILNQIEAKDEEIGERGNILIKTENNWHLIKDNTLSSLILVKFISTRISF